MEWSVNERGDNVAIGHRSGTRVVVTTAPLEGAAVQGFAEKYLGEISSSADFKETSRTVVDSPEGLRIEGVLRSDATVLVLNCIVTTNGDNGLIAGSIVTEFNVPLYRSTLDRMLASFKIVPRPTSSRQE